MHPLLTPQTRMSDMAACCCLSMMHQAKECRPLAGHKLRLVSCKLPQDLGQPRFLLLQLQDCSDDLSALPH